MITLVILHAQKQLDGNQKAWVAEYPETVAPQLAGLLDPRIGAPGIEYTLASDVRTAIGTIDPPLRVDLITVAPQQPEDSV